ncbi:MAG: NUDIX domain-containing protein [Planctomycetota bacterium]
MNPDPNNLPYKIAVLCDLRDAQGRLLMLHRKKAPNRDLYSPIGGKLDQHTGESPAQCARREIQEEAGLDIPIERLHLSGIISEKAYEMETHWLLFYYRVIGHVELEPFEMNEGRLEWIEPGRIHDLPLPETDRKAIWPTIASHKDGGFFALHIDCTGPELAWALEQSQNRTPTDA